AASNLNGRQGRDAAAPGAQSQSRIAFPAPGRKTLTPEESGGCRGPCPGISEQASMAGVDTTPLAPVAPVLIPNYKPVPPGTNMPPNSAQWMVVRIQPSCVPGGIR